MVKNTHSNAGEDSTIPGRRTKISRASGQVEKPSHTTTRDAPRMPQPEKACTLQPRPSEAKIKKKEFPAPWKGPRTPC